MSFLLSVNLLLNFNIFDNFSVSSRLVYPILFIIIDTFDVSYDLLKNVGFIVQNFNISSNSVKEHKIYVLKFNKHKIINFDNII